MKKKIVVILLLIFSLVGCQQIPTKDDQEVIELQLMEPIIISGEDLSDTVTDKNTENAKEEKINNPNVAESAEEEKKDDETANSEPDQDVKVKDDVRVDQEIKQEEYAVEDNIVNGIKDVLMILIIRQLSKIIKWESQFMSKV